MVKLQKKKRKKQKKWILLPLLTDEKPEPFPYDSFIQKAQKELEEKLDGVDLILMV